MILINPKTLLIIISCILVAAGIAIYKHLESVEERHANALYFQSIEPLLLSYEAIFDRMKELHNETPTNKQMYEILSDEIIPEINKNNSKLQSTIPPKKLRGFHEKLIEIMKSQQRGYFDALIAFERNDLTKIKAANENFSQAQKNFRELCYQLEDEFSVESIGQNANKSEFVNNNSFLSSSLFSLLILLIATIALIVLLIRLKSKN